MKIKNTLLLVRQLDKKLSSLGPLLEIIPTSEGWISLLRKTLKMSLRQLGTRMKITPQSVRDIERREKEGSITLNTLRDAGDALNMKLVYGFIPKDGSLERMIELKAFEMAKSIVKRTSNTMKLEDQENSQERLAEAIKELTQELKKEVPKSLWD